MIEEYRHRYVSVQSFGWRGGQLVGDGKDVARRDVDQSTMAKHWQEVGFEKTLLLSLGARTNLDGRQVVVHGIGRMSRAIDFGWWFNTGDDVPGTLPCFQQARIGIVT